MRRLIPSLLRWGEICVSFVASPQKRTGHGPGTISTGICVVGERAHSTVCWAAQEVQSTLSCHLSLSFHHVPTFTTQKTAETTPPLKPKSKGLRHVQTCTDTADQNHPHFSHPGWDGRSPWLSGSQQPGAMGLGSWELMAAQWSASHPKPWPGLSPGRRHQECPKAHHPLLSITGVLLLVPSPFPHSHFGSCLPIPRQSSTKSPSPSHVLNASAGGEAGRHIIFL